MRLIERWLDDVVGRLRALSPEQRSVVAQRAAGENAGDFEDLTALLAHLEKPPRDDEDKEGGSSEEAALLLSGGALRGPLWDRLANELARTEPRDIEIPAGQKMGRYVILRRLGSGGMGSVYVAHDPELDRQVAVKVLRDDLFHDAGTGSAHEQLRSEAQALARLSHPNVVTVHDVGTSAGRVFLAMERVEGEDLAQWLSERPRARREVLAIFRQIGRGLAAAHGAGLVHRDLKPQNVMVGEDGRARILDFGLARAADALRREGTETAAILGTPAYMAPEQLKGQPVDARADQYAFCLVLWEALYGERPFADEALLSERRLRSELPSSEPGVRLPRRLRRTLERGLAADPDERFETMDVLLDALDDGASRRWAAAAGVAAAVVLPTAVWLWPDRTPSCQGAREQLVGVWDAARSNDLATAFSASGSPLAADALSRVRNALARWADGWTAMRTEACEATRVRGEQSEELLDLRIACLDRRRDEAAAFVDLLSTADEASVLEAPEAALKVAPITVCADPRLLTAPAPPPTNPQDRARLEQLEHRLAEAKALRDLGRMSEATSAAEQLSSDVEALIKGADSQPKPTGGSNSSDLAKIRWAAPLSAEVHYLVADIKDLEGDFDGADDALYRAWAAAVRGGHDEYVARALDLFVWLDGNDRSDLAAAQRWRDLASATLERMDAGPLLWAELHNNVGAALQTAGLASEATSEHEQALALRRRLFGDDSIEVAKSLNNLGSAYYTAGRFERADEFYRQALAINQKILGTHPSTAMSWNNVGAALLQLGQTEPAREAQQRSLEIRQKVYGDDSLWATLSRINLAFVDLEDEPRRALEQFQAARSKLAADLPADHPLQAYALAGIGRTLLGLERPAEAIAPLERALAIFEQAGGGGATDLATLHFALAQALWQQRDRSKRERARGLAQQALDELKTLATDELPLRDEVATWIAAHGETA